MLERLDDASQALREIAATTQAVSQKLDRARSGSLEQVYDEAVDNVCLKCGLRPMLAAGVRGYSQCI